MASTHRRFWGPGLSGVIRSPQAPSQLGLVAGERLNEGSPLAWSAADKATDAVVGPLGTQLCPGPAQTTVGRVIAGVTGELDRLHQRGNAIADGIDEALLAEHPPPAVGDPSRDEAAHCLSDPRLAVVPSEV